ncbi:MAG: transcription-repair coupling factor, partial [Gammaproteobacteria bacterium]
MPTSLDSLLARLATQKLPKSGARLDLDALAGSADALAIAQLAARGRMLVVITANPLDAQRLQEEIAWVAPGLRAHLLPDWETLPYDNFSPHQDLISERLSTLYAISRGETDLVLVPASTALYRMAPPAYLAAYTFFLKQGEKLDVEQFKAQMALAGYAHVTQVVSPGEFSVRGGLVDLFPMGSPLPFRIDLFDDEVESIKTFDPDTQRTVYPTKEIRLLPAREFQLDDKGRTRFRSRFRETFEGDPTRASIYKDVSNGIAPAGIEYYLPLFFAQTASLFDHLAGDTLVVLGDGAAESAEAFWAQTSDRWEQRRHDIERPILAPAEIYLPPEELRARLNKTARIEVCGPQHAQADKAIAVPEQPAPSLPWSQKGGDPGSALLGFLRAYPGRTLLAADSAGRREALLELLASADLKPAVLAGWDAFLSGDDRFAITVAGLEDGFALSEPALAVLTERQLFPERAEQSRRRKRAVREPDAVLRDLSEISIGSPIVHEDHG